MKDKAEGELHTLRRTMIIRRTADAIRVDALAIIPPLTLDYRTLHLAARAYARFAWIGQVRHRLSVMVHDAVPLAV